MKVFESIANLFRAPSAEVLAMRELEDAKRSLLEAQSTQEYASHIAGYNQERIARLQRMVKEIA